MTPTEIFLQRLQERTGREPKRVGDGWQSRCPAHDDHKPSLSISEGNDGRALIRCHASCSTEAICESLGLRLSDLMRPTRATNGSQSSQSSEIGSPVSERIENHSATYDYRNETGQLLLQVVRLAPKGFRQRCPKPSGGWTWSAKNARTVPYRLPELLASQDATVFIVEGEKDVDNLRDIGLITTCNAGGAGKWTAEHARFLSGRNVVVLADNDEPGRKHAHQVAATLRDVAQTVRVVDLPGLPNKGDATDWLASGRTADELVRLVEESPLWTPQSQPWPAIIPFDELNLPEFPTHALPDVLREWVEAESHATQTPAELPGLLSLAVCSASIARRVVVEPRPGWKEEVNLYVAVLLGPGNRKSPVFADAIAPLRELEAELIEEARPRVAQLQSDRRQDEVRLKRLEKIAADKGDLEARQEAGKLAAELANQVDPVLPRLIVDDATTEKVGIMLAEQGGRIASMSAEGGVFDLMAGMYSKSNAPQFDVYLKGHSGDLLVTDRVSRESVHVERPTLTCAYAIQPQVIKSLSGNAAFRGRGLLGRFFYAFPSSLIGQREIAPTPVPTSIQQAYRLKVRALATAEGEVTLTLSESAASQFVHWEAEIELMLADGGSMESMRDWGAKLAGATLRLAAIQRCVDRGPVGPIDHESMAAAIAIARYLVPHAEATLNILEAKESPQEEDAQYILRWIQRQNRCSFSRRDAQQHGKKRFPKADDIDPGLEELERRGHIRARPLGIRRQGRPPSPEFDVNPVVFTATPEKGAHNSQYSCKGCQGSVSENIENVISDSLNTNRVEVTI